MYMRYKDSILTKTSGEMLGSFDESIKESLQENRDYDAFKFKHSLLVDLWDDENAKR
jgi:hypothetical protein